MSSRYWPEPTTAPDARRTAIVLVNMGTPPAPETAPTRRYLAEFLNDPRIVEWPRWLWKPILHGIVLRTRPARSAQKYAQVWTPEGSPLAVHTARQSTLLQGHFIWQGKAHIECFHAMRYGQPALARRLGIATKRWQLTFQSRFGRAQWLTPYTQPTLVAMAKEGHKSVDVVCPGFLADCLETREEIAITAKAAFLDAGGETFNFIPCLNEREDWMAALARLTLAHLGDWSHGAAEPSRD